MELKIKETVAIIKDNFKWSNPNSKRMLLGFCTFLVLSGILLVNLFPSRLSGIEIGSPSKQTVKATHNIEFIDNDMTEKLREEASENVEKVYKYDPITTTRAEKNIRGFYNSIREIKANQVLTPEAQLDIVENKFGKVLPEPVIKTALSLSNEEITTFETKTVEITNQLMRDRIVKKDLEAKKGEFASIAASLPYDQAKIDLITQVGTSYLEPNYTYDAAATKQLQSEAAAKVPPYVVKKMKGEIVVREGEIITAEHVKILKELGLLSGRFDIPKILGVLLLVFGILVISGIYLYKYQKAIFSQMQMLLLLTLLLVAVTFFAKVATSFGIPSFVVPIAAIAMLTAILFNAKMAIVMVLISSLLTGIIAENSTQYIMVSILSGMLAIYLVSRISRRTDLTKAGIIVGLGMAYLAFSVSLVAGMGIKDVFLNSGWGLVSGLSSAILTIGTLPLIELAFDITTDIRLLELSDPSQPLLRELMMKAPGTYNHSILTANLAEAAAEKVGANPILTRVGCYYHDIGKIKRPFFFVENQLGCENPHDNTNPNLSYLIITAHVKEGIEIAKKNKLPTEIIDIIGEHHGTSVVAYFFHRAREIRAKEEVTESRFRYSGKKPHSKEAALVMLADSAEAAARTVTKPSPNRLEQLIKKIVREKLEDGQLDESLLTLRDLEKITKSFVQGLTTIYHSRIEYPEGDVVPFKRGMPAHGSNNK